MMGSKRLKKLEPELTACLKELHLPAVRECYQDEARRARSEGLSYEQYLLELMRHEREARTRNRIDRHLRASKLPLEKSTEGSFSFNILTATISSLITGVR